MKQQDNLNWEARQFEDEDHGSVVLRSHYFGLRKIFEGWKPAAPFENLAQMESHYQKMSTKLGFEVGVPEVRVNFLGYRLLQQNKLDEALATFKWNAEHYPESANVYDSLGDGLTAAKQFEQAVDSYKKAMELGEKTNHQFKATFKQNYENARKRLEEALAMESN